ncbi:MAG: hypothetical protein ACI4HL_03780 [Ruminococcus sp.]
MKISVTRKLNSILLASIFILTTFLPFATCMSYSASGKVNYSLNAETCDKDRLFNVDVYVEGKANISAVDVSISFDSSYMEFRRVYGANDAFEIQHKQSNGKISTIILCSYGYSFNGKAKLMTFQFKSIKSGETLINTQIADPVDKNLNSIPIGNVYGCKVSINGNEIKSKTVKTSSSKSKSSVNDGENVKSENIDDKSSVEEEYDYIDSEGFFSDEEETTSPDFVDNYDNNPYLPYVMGAIITIVLVLIIFIAYRLGKNNPKTDTENIDNDSDAEQ